MSKYITLITLITHLLNKPEISSNSEINFKIFVTLKLLVVINFYDFIQIRPET